MSSKILGEIVIIRRNKEDGMPFPLEKDCLIGRDKDADLRVQLAEVSRFHCKVTFDADEKAYLIVLGENGVVLNGKRLAACPEDKIPLSHNDVFEIEGRSFRFQKATTEGESTVKPAREPRTPVKAARLSAQNSPARLKSPSLQSPLKPTKTMTPKKKMVGAVAALGGNLSESVKDSINSLLDTNITATDSNVIMVNTCMTIDTEKENIFDQKSATDDNFIKSPIKGIISKAISTPGTDGTQIQVSLTPSKKSGKSETASPRKMSASKTATPSSQTKKSGSAANSPASAAKRKLFDSSVERKIEEKPITPVKSVSFGPQLSPEIFDKAMPPASPIKRGSSPKPVNSPSKSLLARAVGGAVAAASAIASTPVGVGKSKLSQVVTSESMVKDEEEAGLVEEKVSETENAGNAPVNQDLAKLATPVRKEIVEKAAKIQKQQVQDTKRLQTPLRKEIVSQAKEFASARDEKVNEMQQRMETPVRKEITSKAKDISQRKESQKPLAASAVKTPQRKEIIAKAEEISSKRLEQTSGNKLATPVRKELKQKADAMADKRVQEKPVKALATPLRKSIRKGVELKSIVAETEHKNDVEQEFVEATVSEIVTEALKNYCQDKNVESSMENSTNEAVEKIEENVTENVEIPTEMVEPTAETLNEIVEATVEATTEPVVEAKVEIVESTVEMVEPAVEMVEAKAEPTVESTTEPIVEAKAEMVESTVEPAVEPTDEPIVEPTNETIVEPTNETIVESIETIVEPTNETIVESIETIVESEANESVIKDDPTKTPVRRSTRGKQVTAIETPISVVKSAASTGRRGRPAAIGTKKSTEDGENSQVPEPLKEESSTDSKKKTVAAAARTPRNAKTPKVASEAKKTTSTRSAVKKAKESDDSEPATTPAARGRKRAAVSAVESTIGEETTVNSSAKKPRTTRNTANNKKKEIEDEQENISPKTAKKSLALKKEIPSETNGNAAASRGKRKTASVEVAEPESESNSVAPVRRSLRSRK